MFVKLFEPWGWIVGTGIYIDDVNREIAQITRSIIWISMAITLLIAGTLGYLARTNFLTEQQRRAVQEKLRESMERYKKLVEASTDGVMMVFDNEIAFCNPFLLRMAKQASERVEILHQIGSITAVSKEEGEHQP